MYIGEYVHNIDDKGRAIFPAKFRKQIGEDFIVTKGLDYCLTVYGLSEWKKLKDQINLAPNGKSVKIKRFLFAGAAEVSPDKQGRILIPQSLREYSFLKKDIVFIGVSSNIEIWDKLRWTEAQNELTPEIMAEKMYQLDF